MAKRVRISNERVNSYGFRVLTAGMEVDQYLRNPVLLYMHERGQVIGYMKDVEVKDGEVTGEPVFDEATELSKRCKKQFEFGSLKMVSAGLEIYEMSEDPAHLDKDQKRATVTRCRLYEVSLVDIGSNDDAIVLRHDGRVVNLADGEECPLPLITNHSSLNTDNSINPKKEENMSNLTKEALLALGLKETATEAEVTERIQSVNKQLEELNAAKAQLAAANKQLEEAKKAQVAELVERGIRENRIEAAKRDEFLKLFGDMGLEKATTLLGNMAVRTKPSQLINAGESAQLGATPEGWKSLHDVPADRILKLKAEHPEEYARLYKAEYGVEYKANN